MDETRTVLKRCAQTLSDKKAIDIKVLDLRGKSSITDYFLLATATSEPHLRALRRELEVVLDEEKVRLIGIDYQPLSGWLVVDGFSFMVHLFLPEQRENYALEALWKDGELLPVESL